MPHLFLNLPAEIFFYLFLGLGAIFAILPLFLSRLKFLQALPPLCLGLALLCYLPKTPLFYLSLFFFSISELLLSFKLALFSRLFRAAGYTLLFALLFQGLSLSPFFAFLPAGGYLILEGISLYRKIPYFKKYLLPALSFLLSVVLFAVNPLSSSLLVFLGSGFLLLGESFPKRLSPLSFFGKVSLFFGLALL